MSKKVSEESTTKKWEKTPSEQESFEKSEEHQNI